MTFGKKRWMLIFSTCLIVITFFTCFIQVNDQNALDDKLLNTTFRFLNLPSSSCTPEDKYIILVHSSCINFNRRKTIRLTWGKDAAKKRIKVFFVIGTTPHRKTQNILSDEISVCQDLIQGDFEDTYRNLSLKHVMNFRYVLSVCPSIKYLLKIDDDTFVNIPALKVFLDLYDVQYASSNNVICHRREGHPVLREGKWAVSKEEYSGSTYPTHCLGFAIIYPREAISLLYSVSNKRKNFWIDDVFVTGVLAKAAGVNHTDLTQLILSGDTNVPFLFGGVNMRDSEIKDLWNFMKDHPTKYSLLDYLN